MIVDHPKLPTREEMVDIYAELYGASPSTAKAIIMCESEWRRTAKNPGSSASGYFQFLDSTWEYTMIRMDLPTDTSKVDPIISIQAGVWLLAHEGSRHWNESKDCWSKLL